MIDRAEVKRLFRYCQVTGNLTRRVAIGTAKAGDVAGCLKNNGYLYVKINQKAHAVHRIIWLLVKGEWPTNQIDHINRDRTDNRFENLRDVSAFQNHQNRGNNKTGVVGVCWHKGVSKWQAAIVKNKKTIYLGIYEIFEDAVKARREAEIKFHPLET